VSALGARERQMTVEEQLRNESMTLADYAIAIQIKDQASYDAACTYLQQVVIPFRKRWESYWAPLKSASWKAYKAIQEKFAEGDTAAASAERTIKTEIRKWDDAQQKIEQERQRQAQLEAERAAEEERVQAAIYAEESGASDEEVEAIISAPVAVVAAPVDPAYQRASGVSQRPNWKAKVTDLHALVKAAAKDRSLLHYLEANMTALNARARADRSTMNLPGVVAWNDAVVSARSR
jgi:nicotinamide mononucleotide adenylyltransferase